MPRSRRPQRCDDVEFDRTYISFRTVIDLHGMKANRVLLLRGALLCILVVAGAADVARAQVFAPAPSQVGPPLLPAPPHTPMQRSSPRRRLLFRTVVTPRQRNANARIKIRATVGCVKRIDVERGPRPSDAGQNSAHSGAWTRVNALVLEIQGRGPGPATGTPREGERSSDRESLKTLPPNCCAMIHAEAGLRASRG